MTQEKLTISDRNGRYLMVFSIISVVCILLSKSFDILEKQLNKIYISQSGIPYIKMLQAFPSTILTASIFLLILLIRYCYYEANIFVEKSDSESQQDALKKADVAYYYNLYYFKVFLLGILSNLLISILVESNAVVSNILKLNYAITYIAIITISIIISIVVIRYKYKKRHIMIPDISNDITGAVIFIVVCLSSLMMCMSQQTTGHLEIKYAKQYININLEANSKFEDIIITINNKLVKEINGYTENYFISQYIGKDVSYEEKYKDSETDVFIEENSDYFYYTKKLDIKDYVVEGMNEISITLDIDNRTYVFSNPLSISNSNYEYVKSTYETNINI